MKWGDAPGKAMRHLLDGGGSDDEAAASRDDILGQDVDLNMPDGKLAAFVRRQLANSRMPPTQGRALRAHGGRDKLPARSKADMTYPNCVENGHTSQECKKPKIDMKDQRSFICNESGHPAARCPKAHLKALTRGPAPQPDRSITAGAVRVL